jgi:hypothetical protein
MATINEAGFARELDAFLADPSTYSYEAMTLTLCPGLIPQMYGVLPPRLAHLATEDQRGGLSFDYSVKLALSLLHRAHERLPETQRGGFAQRAAHAIAGFAAPFPDDIIPASPYFLLHGIAQPTLDGAVAKVEDNARIIHETLEQRDGFRSRQGKRELAHGLELRFDNGYATDDSFGIAALLYRQGDEGVTAYEGYLAKLPFFIDPTKGEAVAMSVQGEISPGAVVSRSYEAASSALDMSPRTFLVMQTQEALKREGYGTMKVLLPEEHPMVIERHRGFSGKYLPPFERAGLREREGPYLTCIL